MHSPQRGLYTLLCAVLLFYLVYFLFIRTTGISNFSIIPVFILSLLLASFIIPQGQQTYLDIVKYLLMPIELFVAGFVIYKAHQTIKEYKDLDKSNVDFIESLREILLKQLKNKVAANILTTEIGIFYYAFNGWRTKEEGSNQNAFTYYKKNGYPMVVGVFIFLIVLESFSVHLLLSNWSNVAAWIFTLLSIYGIFFLIGDLNAVRQRRIYLDNDSLHIRIGIRWQMQIPLNEIDEIEFISSDPKSKDNANFILIGSPNILIRCNTEQNAIGLYGISKKFKSISISIDNKESFKKEMEDKIEIHNKK